MDFKTIANDYVKPISIGIGAVALTVMSIKYALSSNDSDVQQSQEPVKQEISVLATVPADTIPNYSQPQGSGNSTNYGSNASADEHFQINLNGGSFTVGGKIEVNYGNDVVNSGDSAKAVSKEVLGLEQKVDTRYQK